MPVTDKSLTVGLSVALVFAAGLVGVTYWVASKPREDVDQSWQQWLSNRRIPAGHGWWQLTGLDGAVELGHMNGTTNGTTTATAGNTAQITTPATADDTVTCAASGTAAATSDATADATTDVTANGAASGPHHYEWYGVLESATRDTWCWRAAQAHGWCKFVSSKASRFNMRTAVLGALLGSSH